MWSGGAIAVGLALERVRRRERWRGIELWAVVVVVVDGGVRSGR